MGYSGKLTEKLLAQKLRGEGLTYKEILLQIDVSKNSISRWCRDISLSDSQKERILQAKELGQKKGSLIASENKRRKRIQEKQIYKEMAEQKIGRLSRRDEFLLGVAYYSAEGEKSEWKSGFANADPQIIKFMMKWFLKYVQLPIQKLRGAIWIHEDLDPIKAKEYWSLLTGIPESQFHKTYIAKSKVDSKKVRKNIHQHGVFSIRFSDSAKQRQIKGWISVVLTDKITNVL